MKKTHDYIHRYRGYWSDGGRCRIRIYHEDGRAPIAICSQLPDNHNTSVTYVADRLLGRVHSTSRVLSGARRSGIVVERTGNVALSSGA